MADELELPQQLTRTYHRDRNPRRELLARRAFMLLLTAFLVAALANVFGQGPERWRAATATARLEVSAPTSLRSGLIYQSRFTVEAVRELKKAILVLSPGWAEGITINTIEPSPEGEASRGRGLSLQLGHVPAGERYVLYLEQQANPTTFGIRRQRVDLLDGGTRVLHLERGVTVYP